MTQASRPLPFKRQRVNVKTEPTEIGAGCDAIPGTQVWESRAARAPEEAVREYTSHSCKLLANLWQAKDLCSEESESDEVHPAVLSSLDLKGIAQLIKDDK
ncbi:unnamed protein product, partial [Polarella glacialis]